MMNPEDQFKPDGVVHIIHENGQPYGIRDKRGYLLFFPKVRKWGGQEERYKRELQQLFALAEQIKTALRDVGVEKP